MVVIERLQLLRGRFALTEISLHVGAGEYFCLLGPTGSGKTMLVECLAGLNRPDSGRIFLHGRDVTSLRPELRGISYVPQDYALFPHWTVRGNIAAPCRARRWKPPAIEERVAELSALMHIRHLLDRYPHNLSGGEKQRVALARALAVMPQLLLLDEPFSALDQQTKARLWPEMKALHERLRVTTIHVTHDFEEAALMATRLGVMENGRIVQVGAVEEVFDRPATGGVARFVGAENILAGRAESTEDGCCCIRIASGVRLCAGGCHCGHVRLVIRPEAIIVTNGDGDARGQNVLRGHLRAIVPLRSVVRLMVDAGTPLVAAVSHRDWKQRPLKPGQPVTLSIPPEAIHVLEGEGRLKLTGESARTAACPNTRKPAPRSTDLEEDVPCGN